MIIISHHRSAALADRKRRDLEARYPESRVELLSRRNEKGWFSNNGHTFTWEVTPTGARLELVVHFDYGSEKSKNLIRFQVHVFGPGNATDAEAISAIRQANKGEGFPKSWRKRAIYWGHPPKSENQTKPLPSSLRRTAIAAGAASVVATRQITARSNRRAGRKAEKK